MHMVSGSGGAKGLQLTLLCPTMWCVGVLRSDGSAKTKPTLMHLCITNPLTTAPRTKHSFFCVHETMIQKQHFDVVGIPCMILCLGQHLQGKKDKGNKRFAFFYLLGLVSDIGPLVCLLLPHQKAQYRAHTLTIGKLYYGDPGPKQRRFD